MVETTMFRINAVFRTPEAKEETMQRLEKEVCLAECDVLFERSYSIIVDVYEDTHDARKRAEEIASFFNPKEVLGVYVDTYVYVDTVVVKAE